MLEFHRRLKIATKYSNAIGEKIAVHKRDIGKIETPRIDKRYEGGCPENEAIKTKKL